jgi:hypothetical protein
MRLRTSRYLVAFIGLLVFMFAGQAGVQGYVLCVADGCHVEFEISKNASCDSAQGQAEDHHSPDWELNGVDAEDHCGPCLDIAATNEFSSTSKQLKNIIFPLANLPVAKDVLTFNIIAKSNSRIPVQAIPRISQTLLAQSTIVLLV